MPHTTANNRLLTPDGVKRGYIQAEKLTELWFHTGTDCNLGCSFCYEDAKPGDRRIELLTFVDAKQYIDEAVKIGVERFSFTGGEPFVNKEFLKILSYALEHRPCLVLTNGTGPIRTKFDEVLQLKEKPNKLKFRISIDHPDEKEHDNGRGKGSFAIAMETLSLLHQNGFNLSVARYGRQSEDKKAVEEKFRQLFIKAQLPKDTKIVVFYNLFKANKSVDVPHITENCMTTYKDEKSRAEFMCSYSRMIVKKNGQTGVYACTLVDDDNQYNLSKTLKETIDVKIMLGHHRCFSCFSSGTSCSEG